MGFANTGWVYEGSSGGAGSVGEAVEITAGQARIVVSDPAGQKYKIIGTGVGGGFGISWLPASVTYSAAEFRSAGSGIYAFDSGHITIDDLSCLMVIYSASALLPVALGGAGSVALFVNPDTLQKITLAASVLTPVGLLGILAALTGSFKAACCFAGLETSTPQLGADVTGTAYWISSADPQ